MKKLFLFMILIILVSGCGEKEEKKEEAPKIDNSDLVCTGILANYDEYRDKVVVTISFDENAVITQYEEKYVSDVYVDKESDESGKGYNSIEDYSQIIEVDKDNSYYGKTKQEMRDIYVNQLYYDCK